MWKPVISRSRCGQVGLYLWLLVGLPSCAWSAAFVYSFGSLLSGASLASSAGPWLQAEFMDTAPGQVRVTITAENLTRGESLRELYLNLSALLNPGSLIFSRLESVGSFAPPVVSAGNDAFKVSGDGRYDLRFSFAAGGDACRFGTDEQVMFLVSGIPGLSAASFAFPSAPAASTRCVGPQEPLYAAAQIQVGGPCGASSWLYPADGPLPVPEPTTAALFGLAFILWIVRSRRSRVGRSARREASIGSARQ